MGDVHTVFLSQPCFLIGSFVLNVRRVFSTAVLIRNKLVPVLHHFRLLIPEPLSLWQLERSWIFAVDRQVCKHPIFFGLHYTLCYHRQLCRNHLLLNHRTLSKDGLSTNQLAKRFLQLLNRQPEALATAPKCFVEARHRSVFAFSKKLMPASVKLEKRTLGFLVARFRVRFH